MCELYCICMRFLIVHMNFVVNRDYKNIALDSDKLVQCKLLIKTTLERIFSKTGLDIHSLWGAPEGSSYLIFEINLL